MTRKQSELSFLTDDDMHIVDLADEESDDDEAYMRAVLEAHNHLSAPDLLHQLIQPTGELRAQDLRAFSDLSRADMEYLQARWHEVPVERRRLMVKGMVESAAENLELQLGRFLRVAMRDSDAEVRRLAVEGLWEDDDPDLIGPLIRLLNHDEAEGVRAAAAAALGSFILAGELDELDAALAMRAEEALLAVVHNEATPLTIRCRALESIAYSGEAGLHQLIENAYYSSEVEMQVSALRAMGRSADTRWRGLARAELHNSDAPMRAAAVWACGELEVKAATQEVIALLDDPEVTVRMAAISALGQLGGKSARDALRQIAEGDDPQAVEAAEAALDEILFYEEGGADLLFGDDDDDDDFWTDDWRDEDDDTE